VTDHPPQPAETPGTSRVLLSVEGMHCASCVAGVERALSRVPGVRSAAVNLAAGSAAVDAEPGVEPNALAEAVRRAGFDARPITPEAADDPARDPLERDRLRVSRRLLIAAVATAPLVVLEMGGHLVPAFHHALMHTLGERTLRAILFALAAIVQFGPGLRFYTDSLPGIRRLRPDMNALVMLGTSAAFGFSAVVTLAPSLVPEASAHVYFEASAVIITLVLLGRRLELGARGRTSGAVRALLELRPPTARVRRDGREQTVAAEDVRVGDEVLVRPGERLAIDGVVTEGEAHVDESMLTGEPMPIRRTPGDRVVGGSVAQSGSLIVRATGVGRDTVLSQIVRTVREAQASKLPIQAAADRVVSVFVPVVLLIAILTLVAWVVLVPERGVAMGVSNAVAVLIIACPCAMGLATPTSIVVATGRAARAGVLFRRGDALERISRVRGALLDKTGTLTAGEPKLTEIRLIGTALNEDDLLALAAGAESRSEHPLARAVLAEGERRGMTIPVVRDFDARPGRGVRANVNGRDVAVGSAPWLRELGIEPAAMETDADAIAAEGGTPILVAINGRPTATLGVRDPLRPDAAEGVRALRELGLEVELVTGDRERTARAVGASLGIERVRSEVMPNEKAELVRAARHELGPILFAGDGINDAPALAAAEVGIAVAGGTDVAIESADVVLIAPGVLGVARSVRTGRAAMRNIRQNLFWAFAYNTALIPIAAGVLYPWTGWLLNPMLAAGAMSLSSVSVVANALRLRGMRL